MQKAYTGKRSRNQSRSAGSARVITSGIPARRAAAINAYAQPIPQFSARAQQQAAMMYRQVRGTTENKFYDPVTNSGSGLAISFAANGAVANSAGLYILDTAATASAIVLNQIPQGTTQSTRLARRAHITGVHIKGLIYHASGSVSATNVCMDLIHQTAPNNPSSMPAFNTIWLAQNSNALRNVNDSDKLKVVRTPVKQILEGDSAAPTTGLEAFVVDEVVDLRKAKIVTEWTTADTTGVYGNMEKGALLLYARSTHNVAHQFNGSIRVYFEDY